jgi:type II secretory pathway pseudopilin PulG
MKYELIKGIPVKRKCTAFTIVELLVSLVIITILIGLLLPSIAMVRRKAKETAQTAQITTIGSALDTFRGDYGDYPPSSWPDIPLAPPLAFEYCGAQKLAEALLGWDLMGFHPDTAWRADGADILNGNLTYDPGLPAAPPRADPDATIRERTGRYVELSTVNVFQLADLFTTTDPLRPDTHVLCDVFGVKKKTLASETVKMGTPILYYKADTSKSSITNPSLQERIYDYRHNRPLIALGSVTKPGGTAQQHPLGYDPGTGTYPVFYDDQLVYPGGTGYGIVDPQVTNRLWPYRPDSYILISAGMDGLYGTRDDITNY